MTYTLDMTPHERELVEKMLERMRAPRPTKSCPHCGAEFPAVSWQNGQSRLNCGKPKCKRAALIDAHGGVEGYRKWERERRNPTSDHSGKRGRPKKTADAETRRS